MLLQRQVVLIITAFLFIRPARGDIDTGGVRIGAKFLIDMDNPASCSSEKINVNIQLYNPLSTKVVVECSPSPANELAYLQKKYRTALILWKDKSKEKMGPAYIERVELAYLPVSGLSGDTSWYSFTFPIERIILSPKELNVVIVEVPLPEKPGDYIAIFRLRPSVSANKRDICCVPPIPQVKCSDLPSRFTAFVHVEKCRGKTKK